mmetsp:Transcript_129509/g.375097  ORF Transcript_129509/g.375097 Transcript_129509/m.375097 type:complete len:378 (+) Transcript_129509:96-1229(+)
MASPTASGNNSCGSESPDDANPRSLLACVVVKAETERNANTRTKAKAAVAVKRATATGAGLGNNEWVPGWRSSFCRKVSMFGENSLGCGATGRNFCSGTTPLHCAFTGCCAGCWMSGGGGTGCCCCCGRRYDSWTIAVAGAGAGAGCWDGGNCGAGCEQPTPRSAQHHSRCDCDQVSISAVVAVTQSGSAGAAVGTIAGAAVGTTAGAAVTCGAQPTPLFAQHHCCFASGHELNCASVADKHSSDCEGVVVGAGVGISGLPGQVTRYWQHQARLPAFHEVHHVWRSFLQSYGSVGVYSTSLLQLTTAQHRTCCSSGHSHHLSAPTWQSWVLLPCGAPGEGATLSSGVAVVAELVAGAGAGVVAGAVAGVISVMFGGT